MKVPKNPAMNQYPMLALLQTAIRTGWKRDIWCWHWMSASTNCWGLGGLIASQWSHWGHWMWVRFELSTHPQQEKKWSTTMILKVDIPCGSLVELNALANIWDWVASWTRGVHHTHWWQPWLSTLLFFRYVTAVTKWLVCRTWLSVAAPSWSNSKEKSSCVWNLTGPHIAPAGSADVSKRQQGTTLKTCTPWKILYFSPFPTELPRIWVFALMISIPSSVQFQDLLTRRVVACQTTTAWGVGILFSMVDTVWSGT